MMKILFFTNLPAPYRVHFFSELGKLSQLTVVYEQPRAEDRDEKWVAEGNGSYREVLISNKREILQYLQGGFDHIIIGVYSTPAARFAISYMRRNKIPFIISTDGGLIKQHEPWFKKVIKRRLIGSASAWLATGKVARKYLVYYGAKEEFVFEYPFTSVGEKDIAVSPSSESEKQVLRTKLGLPDKPVVVSVGQFIPRKGFDVLISAVGKMKTDAAVYIIGGKREQLESLTGEPLPSNVYTIPFLTKEQLFDYYRAADLFVLPTREDIWGLVINEAMACGMPIITTDHCVAGLELVKDADNGYLVPVGDSSVLAEKIDAIMASNVRIRQMGEASLRRIRYYTYENCAREHIRILSELKR